MASDGLTLKQRLTNRWSSLKTIRQPWDEHAYELARFVAPYRGRRMSSGKGGGKRHGSIMNGTATWALRTLASGLRAGTASPDSPWFRLEPEDQGLAEFKPVKEWLEWPMRVIYSILARSNFYEEYHTSLTELGLFGTQALAHNEHRENIARFTAWTWGRYAASNNADGVATTVYREYQDTVENLASRWGKERLSVAARNALDNGRLDERIDVIQAIEPNSRRWAGSAGSRWDFATAYFEKGADDGRMLFVGGMPEAPVHVSRWDLILPDAYGSSPAMDALGDVKQLQLEERRKAQGLDNLVGQGAMQGPPLINGLLDRTPGAYNPVPGYQHANRVSPLIDMHPSTIQTLGADIQGIEDRINRAFYADLFLMMAMTDRRQVTATEVAERHGEKMLALGPVLTRQSSETLSRVIERLFNTIIRASAPLWPDGGIVPPPPPELQDQDLKIDYVSTLFAAQKAMRIGPLQQFVSLTDQVLAAHPDAAMKRNADEIIEQYADLTGVSAKVYRSEEEVRAIREQQQAAEQAQAGAAMGLEAVQKLGAAKTEGTMLSAIGERISQR